MHGAGSSPAGATPAGLDVVVQAPTQRAPAPAALRLDLGTRDFVVIDGAYAELHPVDQEVLLALGIEKGKLASTPDVGNRIRRNRRVAPAILETVVRNDVRLDLAHLLDAGKIELLAVDVDTSVRGQTKVAITYRNLRLNPGAPARVVPLAIA